MINYTEFLAAALETQGAIAEYKLAEAFDQIDSDDSGYISRENLREIVGKIGDDRYIDQLIAEADSKRDGRISYEDFLQLFSLHNKDKVGDLFEEVDGGPEAAPSSADRVLREFGLERRSSSTANLMSAAAMTKQ